MARLFISYKSEERRYALAIRQWLIDERDWPAADIFVDLDHLRAGETWADKIFAEAEGAEVMLFLASEAALHPDSFCYRELRRARGEVLAVTLGGLSPVDDRLIRALPFEAPNRQIAAIDRQPTRPFPFTSPADGSNGSADLNPEQIGSIGGVLRDLGVAPNSFGWPPAEHGPYPGLRALQEGDEAIFCGRDLEIRDGLRALVSLSESAGRKALLIHAPSGAGKSSFLRAGLWRRLRRHPAFTPLAIVRPTGGAISHEDWGLAAGLCAANATRLDIAPAIMAERAAADPAGLLREIAEADAGAEGRRTLLIGIDQAEEMTTLDGRDEAEMRALLALATDPPKGLDIRLALTARDDSVDAVLAALETAGAGAGQVQTWRLHRMSGQRYRDVVRGPAEAAERAGWPLKIDGALEIALAEAAARDAGETGDALPLLSLALHRLTARHRTPKTGLVDLAPDQAQGFLDTVIATAMGEAMAAAGADGDALRRLAIPRLATWDPNAGEGGAAKREVALEAELLAGDRADLRALADAMVERRLLTRTGAGAEARLEVAHEALLRTPPLGDLIYERRGKFALAAVLAAEARDWRAHGEAEGRLARRDDRLAEAQALLGDPDFGPQLRARSEAAADYLAACAAHARAEDARREALRQEELALAEDRAAAAEVAREAAEKERAAATRAQAASEEARAATRRVASRTRLGLAVALLLAIMAGGAAFLANDAANEAEAQRRVAEDAANEAELQTRTARTNAAGALAALAAAERGRPVEAAKLALAAWPRNADADFDAPQAVLETLGQIWPDLHERTRFEGHEARVTSVALSADGARVLTGSFDKTARLWDAATGAEIRRFEGHERVVTSVALSADGARVLTGSHDDTARLWDAATGAEITRFLGHEDLVTSVALSADGARVLTGSYDNTARLWDAATGAEIRRFVGHEDRVYSVALSADGARVLTGSWDETARLWDAATGAEIRRFEEHESYVNSVALSADGARVLTGSYDNTARLWDAATGAEIRRFVGHEDRVYSVALSADGARVLTGSWDKTARLWDAATGAEIRRFLGHEHWVSSVALSADGARVLTGSQDKTARLWDAATGAEIRRFLGHEHWVSSVALSADGARVLTGSRDDTARLWDAATGAEIRRFVGHESRVESVALSADGARVLTGSDDNTARLWDAATGAEIRRFVGHEDTVESVALSADGARVLTGSRDGTARLWDAATGAEITRFVGHERAVSSVALSADGARVLTGSVDETARLWDAATGAEIRRFEGHEGGVNSVAFSADGARVLTGSEDRTARLWDAATGAEITRFVGHERAVSSVALSADGARVLTGSFDKTARLWDAATGAEITRFGGHESVVTSVALSADGARVLTGAWDRTARLWDISDVPEGNAFRIACAWLPDHDLSDIVGAYAIEIEEPICGDDYDPPDPGDVLPPSAGARR